MVFKLPKKEVMKSSDLGKEVIKKELPLIPKSPGVYKMLNHKGDILYVGKAKNLPNRLKSYVAEKNHIIRTERMLSQTFKLEITTTANESEALLLEANLIKKHKPKFNILLKDDKSFPFIFISNKDNWPQVTKHRGKKDKEGFYFGPFASAGSANWTIKMLQKVFQLRICDEGTFKNRERPCILYQIKRCSAPCVNYIEQADYKKSVEDAIQFVSGKSREIQKSLSKQMEEASEKLDFEKASIFRDRIKSLNIIQSSQRVNEANLIEADVIAAYKESGKTCIQVFFYRAKQNWGNQSYFPKHDPDQSVEEIMSSFIMQFYENKSVPKSIIINLDIKDKKLIEETLTQKENSSIIITIAKKGSKAKVVSLAEKNAKEALKKIKQNGIKRKHVGLIIDCDPLSGPNTTFWPIEKDGKIIGKVTSAVYSPRLKKNIALAMLSIDHTEIGDKFKFKTNNSEFDCTVVEKPFYDPKKKIASS